MTEAVGAMMGTDPTVIKIELVRGMSGRVVIANERKFE
jgi:hypothetical protein